ncbi:MAG: nucleotidyltransferase domain-containing protein [Clostridia bacterium]|nr:nucleotidyltransferase domain-containing protein [Clostridia bacterium]
MGEARKDALVSQLRAAFKKRKEVAGVFLFGSYGTEYETKFSDIDLGVVFLPEMKIGLTEELDLDAYLSLELGTDKLDVVNLNKAPIQLRFNAISQGELIYEADFIATRDFIEETINLYQASAYHMRKFREERLLAIKEAYSDGK